MSCQAGAARFAGLAGRLSGGINRLSSQQAFYSGLAVGASGGLGVSALAWLKRDTLRRTLNRFRPAGSAPVRPQARAKQVRPIPQLRGTDRRALKPGDPKKASVQSIPALAARRQPVKLQAEPVTMQVGQGQSYTAADSYRVVRADGSETGLALTPYLTRSEPEGAIERSEQWGLTHLSSGALVSGPYESVAEAQELAGQLAPLAWTKPRLPAAEMQRAKTMIDQYQADVSS